MKEENEIYIKLLKFLNESQDYILSISKFNPKTKNYGFFLRNFEKGKKNEVEVELEYIEVYNEDKFETKRCKLILILDKSKDGFRYKKGSFISLSS